MKNRVIIEQASFAGANPPSIIAQDPAMREALKIAKRVARTNATVLLRGETGVGKDLVAHFIHSLSDRKTRTFLPVNCSAIPETLLESQFFGYIKGAFTGAVANQDGLFQQAAGGTLFLDEIGEMSLALQSKLLRAIDEKEVLRVGATTPIKIDVRFIAATHRDLAQEVKAGRFRLDLYHRLKIIELQIPPLRERREDIIPLVKSCLTHLVAKHRNVIPAKDIAPETLDLLRTYSWPGNVRELKAALESAFILAGDETLLSPNHLWQEIRRGTEPLTNERIEQMLNSTDGNVSQAARQLGVSRSTVYHKLSTRQSSNGSGHRLNSSQD
jgi:two-component system, NtrC family, response regulator HydG